MDLFKLIEQEYNNNYFYLKRFLLKLTNDEKLSEDIIQEVFTKVLLKPRYISDVKNIRSWLVIVARNTLIDHFNSNKDILLKNEELFIKLLIDNSDPSDIVIYNLKLTEVFSTITKMEKAIFLAFEYYGYTYKEMALLFELPVTTIKTRLFRVRKKLLRKERF